MIPLGNKVLVQGDEKLTVTKGGIHLPDNAAETPQTGTVLAVGSGRLLDNGKRAGVEVKVGDRVKYKRYAGYEVNENERLLLLTEEDILAKLEADDEDA
jgi:chaperonin GroES